MNASKEHSTGLFHSCISAGSDSTLFPLFYATQFSQKSTLSKFCGRQTLNNTEV